MPKMASWRRLHGQPCPLRVALGVLASAYVRRGPVPVGELIEGAGAELQPTGLLTPRNWTFVVEQAEVYRLVVVDTKDGPALGEPPVAYVEPA